MKKIICFSIFFCLFDFLVKTNVHAQFVGINNLTPVFELDIRTNDANDGSIINLGNLDNGHFLRFFSGKQLDFPFPSIYWKNGDPLSLGTDLNGYTEIMKLKTDGSLFLNSQSGIVLDQGNLPLITRGYDPFTSGAYSGLGRWGMFMEPFYLTLGMPQIPGRGFQFVTYDNNSAINKILMRVNENGNVGIGTPTPSARLHVIESSASGSASEFNNTNLTNSSTTLRVLNSGDGGAGYFFSENSTGVHIHAQNAGGLIVQSWGDNGSAGDFRNYSSTNPNSVIYVGQSGTGRGLHVGIDNTSSTSDVISAFNLGTGNVIKAENLVSAKDKTIAVIIYTWDNIEAWHIWENSSIRKKIIQQADTLLLEQPRVMVYHVMPTTGWVHKILDD